jgi:hypothetical protein
MHVVRQVGPLTSGRPHAGATPNPSTVPKQCSNSIGCWKINTQHVSTEGMIPETSEEAQRHWVVCGLAWIAWLLLVGWGVQRKQCGVGHSYGAG